VKKGIDYSKLRRALQNLYMNKVAIFLQSLARRTLAKVKADGIR